MTRSRVEREETSAPCSIAPACVELTRSTQGGHPYTVIFLSQVGGDGVADVTESDHCLPHTLEAGPVDDHMGMGGSNGWLW